jgi:hypothetical protein
MGRYSTLKSLKGSDATFTTSTTMISIVYGSLVAGLPNNQDAFVGGHGRHFAQYLRTGSTNYPPSPSPFHVSS